MCGVAKKTVKQIVSESPKLAQKEYKQVRKMLPKWCIGSYVKNGDSIKQRNGTHTNQKGLEDIVDFPFTMWWQDPWT